MQAIDEIVGRTLARMREIVGTALSPGYWTFRDGTLGRRREEWIPEGEKPAKGCIWNVATRVPWLTREEEGVLLARAHAGDVDAKARLMLSCYPMIKSILSRVCDLNFDDAFQECAIVAGIAVDYFEPGVARFKTYVYHCVYRALGNLRRQEVKQENGSGIDAQRRMQALSKVREAHVDATGKEMAAEDIALVAKMSVKRAQTLHHVTSEPCTIEEMVLADPAKSVDDVLCDKEDLAEMRAIVDLLPPDLYRLIGLRLAGLNYIEIAELEGGDPVYLRTKVYKISKRLRGARERAYTTGNLAL